MTDLNTKLEFKYTWRSYQANFLSRFESHKKDNHLHIVAPPGSGKTILGLEMMLRVNKPTLVLSPTLTIRNQWQSRLEEFFRNDESFADYTLDIKKPKLLTFSTYQSLHALDKALLKEEKELVAYIKKHKIGTLVLDEAHHLKNAWWKSLMCLKEIEGLTVIALTATPPYDSTNHELSKYFELCGDLDDEIAVPDLIKNGDLCPHQDFVHFSKPAEEQIKFIVTYREQILAFNNALVANQDFQKFLLNHPYYAQTEASLDDIYENPSFFSAILIFLNASGYEINLDKLKVLGFNDTGVQIPTLNYEWLEILLQQLLVAQREDLIANEALLNRLEKELSRIGVYEKKRVNFVGDEQLYRSLASSPSKLKSIAAILKAERQSLKEDLKAVVLTDFIRKEFLDFSGSDTKALNKLGVVSIFQYLRATTVFDEHLAVLTGSLVIIHTSILPHFEKLVHSSQFNSTPLSDENFVIINVASSAKNKIVAAITDLFQQGVVKVLVGTKSLLGEGWDAPAMNTLILASYVGSFVSSNQMRGRAIRIDPNAPAKTGNIWHLACIDPTVTDGGKDIEKLHRRFEAFSGVSLAGTTYIESGLERLQIPKIFDGHTRLESQNEIMIGLSAERSSLKNRWFEAIEKGSILVREVKSEYQGKLPYKKEKRLRWGNVSKYLLVEVGIGASLLFPELFAKHIGLLFGNGVFKFIYLFLGAVFIGFAPKTYKAIKLYFMFGNTHKKTKKMGKALLHVLHETKNLHTPLSELTVTTDQRLNGSFVCYLKGATNAESSLFVHLLAEILAPIENPRYLLVYRHWIKKHWGMRNFYVVPALFGKRKKDAQLFHKYWRTYVDRSRLLYTRSAEGRKSLLKARLSHILYQFKEVSKTAITWK